MRRRRRRPRHHFGLARMDVLRAVALREALLHGHLHGVRRACAARTRPFARLRRRVCGSSPSRPTGAPSASQGVTGSSSTRRPAMRSVRASGVATNPAGPCSMVAQGWPSSSCTPTSSVGSRPNSSRCWSGMWSRIATCPTASSRSRTPACDCIGCSPRWTGVGVVMSCVRLGEGGLVVQVDDGIADRAMATKPGRASTR